MCMLDVAVLQGFFGAYGTLVCSNNNEFSLNITVTRVAAPSWDNGSNSIMNLHLVKAS
jgi:hypothetical protein